MFRQLKITYLLESTQLWGGTKVAFEQAEALADYGHDVKILSKDPSPEWYPLKLPVIQVPNFDSHTIPHSDIIVGTFWTTVKSAYSSGRGLLVHLCQGYEGDNIELSKYKNEIEEVYSYKIPKITTSKHLNDFLQRRFNSETYYVGQMLNREIFYPERESKFTKYLRKLKTSPFRILIVGPFQADVKNIGASLRGVLLAETRYKVPINLVRVSQFPLTAEEEAIRKPDKFLYHIPHLKMGSIYREADLFISMSKEAEGFGLPALEAMACGIPTILSSISSYKSFDDVLDYSIFVEPSDHETLALAIGNLYKDSDLRNRLIKRGLEVASRFSKEGVVERLNRAFEKILAKARNLDKTKSYWDDFHLKQRKGKIKHWWDSPVVIEHCQERITGNANMTIFDFIKEKIPSLPFERALSICSGSGDFERELIEKGICNQVDAYEISPLRVKEGERIAQEGGYKIKFLLEDVNRAVFKRDHYDLFISWSALHHIENLEGVCKNVYDSLKKGGILLVQEYIGPNQLQWSEKQLEIINRILSTLPNNLRRKSQQDMVIDKIERPTLEHMNEADPSEAIRSEEILATLMRFFDLKTMKFFGGSIFNPLLNGIIENFDHTNEKDVSLLKLILLMEDILIENKILEDNYVFLIAEKKSTD